MSVEALRPAQDDSDLPGTGRALWNSMRLAYQAEPRLLIVAFALVAGALVPDALAALWLKLLTDGVLSNDRSQIFLACGGLGAAAAAGWVMRTVGQQIEARFRDRATITIEAHVARLQASAASIELHERPDYLDRLQILRDHSFLLNHIYSSAMNMAGSLARLLITLVLLASVHPVLLFLGIAAVPIAVVSNWRTSIARKAEEGAAHHLRLGRHLFDLGTASGPGKDLRVTGVDRQLVARRRAAWDGWYRTMARVRWINAFWSMAVWGLFGCAYVGAIVFVANGINGTPGDVVLVLAAGGRLSQYLGNTVGQISFLRWTIDAAARLVWLEEYVAAHLPPVSASVPTRLADGIAVRNVSFSYPGTDRLVLEDIDLDFPAGSIVAIVGENGAGKSTLVKLLCGLYSPTVGEVTVDGVDLRTMPPEEWRSRLAGAFQDFFRFEFTAQRTVGVGDLAKLDDETAVRTAVARGGASDVLAILPDGLDTQLGPTWTDGTDLSFGQWQKLALSRGFMRERPLLCVLDEPTAALDAETEHTLFESFAAAARTAREDGRVTVLVSHRFSTVRVADIIVVLDGSKVVECGPHAELMAKNGLYAELYGIQANAYR